MPTLDAVLTLALPVNAAQLVANLQTYLDTLPALNALRACNRFGKGPQCHITKLPVELVQSVANYYILPVREELARQCNSQFRCFEDKCSLRDHRTREDMLEMHYRYVDFCECEELYDPSDDHLSDCLGDFSPFVQEEGLHPDNRDNWDIRVHNLEKSRPLFRKHFGLDLWLSTVCLGEAQRTYGEAETTIACLSLPGRQERSEMWTHFEDEDTGYEYRPLPCNSGCSMAVMMDAYASPEDVQRFRRATKILELDVFVHETQQNKKPLSLAPTEPDSAPVVDDSEASYPRPMFLVRTRNNQW
jgi:hypothetical protein